MVQCLKERSLCDMVFVSCSCSAAAELASRDMNVNTAGLLKKLIAMLSYINSSEIDICLVVIDFAGLSTNVNDNTDFSSESNCIQKIIVGKLLDNNKFHEFKRERLC
ncbi:hypothetical protein BDF20DRAFT_934379 [Mycotypha africana]|uniref:uncharacterized protein n=1 Tax=Mycotypha africana TaxID=64632 RepID=UPI002300E2B4|nr:uncharacterized protein BDF20DRAFT_934379 [Mycotypha africana]KAI8984175.1 hypothetical protein BDF20DRAFT_934379 [Mycotypha africana]